MKIDKIIDRTGSRKYPLIYVSLSLKKEFKTLVYKMPGLPTHLTNCLRGLKKKSSFTHGTFLRSDWVRTGAPWWRKGISYRRSLVPSLETAQGPRRQAGACPASAPGHLYRRPVDQGMLVALTWLPGVLSILQDGPRLHLTWTRVLHPELHRTSLG